MTTKRKITALRQAAVDAAVELDWMKNGANVDEETRARSQRIVDRIFEACEALDSKATA